MDTNKHEFGKGAEKLLLKDEVYQIVGCAMEVLNGVGHGLHEKIYENALTVEFKLRVGVILNFKHSKLEWERIVDRKSTRLNSSHIQKSRMPSSA